MSTAPENEFDLEKLFLPAWAQEPSSAKYANYEVREERPERRGGRDRRGPRREGAPAGRREDNRPRGERRGPPRGEGGRNRPQGQRGPGGERHGGRRDERPERREPPAPLPEIEVNLIPEEKGVESLARQIKMTGRAYPLFDIAQLILQKPERHMVAFKVKKNAEGQVIQPLFACALDDTLWLSEDEAVSHVLRKHFATFYQAEKTAAEPPKGKYTFVAQCGMSGVILGPPNHHDYQTQLRKLHTERFSRMPFEVYKSRVKIVKDEEVVKKWVEEQSWKTEYLCLNLPEPLKLSSMEEVEKHFRETHKENIIKPVESQTLTGTAARNLRCPPLSRLVRNVWEDQRRFPLQIATVLSQQFASHGLQFFKVNKAITHVSVARPHYLDLSATPVSEGVKKIVEYIDSHAKCTRRQLIESLAPTPPAPVIPVIPVPAEAPAPAEGQPAAEAQAPAEAAPKPEAAQPTPEQNALIADLHWLVHQGHVIEFANGSLETAKKPVPKPPKPPKAAGTTPPGEATAPAPAEPGAAAVEPEVQPDIVRPADQTVAPEAPEAEAATISRPADATPNSEPEPSTSSAAAGEASTAPANTVPAAPPLESP